MFGSQWFLHSERGRGWALKGQTYCMSVCTPVTCRKGRGLYPGGTGSSFLLGQPVPAQNVRSTYCTTVQLRRPGSRHQMHRHLQLRYINSAIHFHISCAGKPLTLYVLAVRLQTGKSFRRELRPDLSFRQAYLLTVPAFLPVPEVRARFEHAVASAEGAIDRLSNARDYQTHAETLCHSLFLGFAFSP